MFDENENFEMDANDFEGTPADEIEEAPEQEEAAEQEQDFEEGTPAEEEEAPAEPFLRIKYNHEEMGLSQDEAAMLAQKGMNYDKLVEKVNTLSNDPARQYLEQLAARSDMSVDQLLDYWKAQEEENEINELISQNIPEEYAREMYESRKFREQLQAQQREQQQQERQNQEYREFFDNFPGVKPEEIPPEVWQINKSGVPLKYAYMEYQYKNLNTQNSMLRKNQENKRKAPGLGVTSHGSKATGGGDPFLEGFNE